MDRALPKILGLSNKSKYLNQRMLRIVVITIKRHNRFSVVKTCSQNNVNRSVSVKYQISVNPTIISVRFLIIRSPLVDLEPSPNELIPYLPSRDYCTDYRQTQITMLKDC
jgi:hypothetical protein